MDTKSQKKSLFCVNCGKYGHLNKICFEPVTSYGIILFYREKDNNIINKNFKIKTNPLNGDNIKYLLIQRKDSLNYVEFFSGKYNIENISFLNTMFSEMTIVERNKILTEDFDILWNDLWGEKSKKKTKSNYTETYEKYCKLKDGFTHPCGEFISLSNIVENNNCIYSSPEWGFPKGKRNYKEKNLQVALREFTEETGIDSDKIQLVKQITPINEIFLASNNVYYKHVYYVATINELVDVNIDMSNSLQFKEVGNIGWYNYIQINNMFRNYDLEKKQILKKLNIYLKNFIFADEFS
jgi:8-oxo-dGTP pyrophosphatase MutT (NUDIX family)